MKRLTITLFLLLACLTRAQGGEVVTIPDLAYTPTDIDKNKLDLYMPKGAKDCPVVMFVHGGGYRRGDRKDTKDLGPVLAAEGVGVAVISYRLIPTVKHPEQIGDVALALAWLKANVAKHGGSPDKLFVMGHSAGAHLATMLGSNPDFLGKVKLGLKDLKGVIALEGYYTPMNKEMFGGEKGLKEVTPATYASSQMPAYLLLYSDGAGKRAADLATDLEKAIRDGKGTADAVLVKERNHTTLLSKIASDEPTGKAILDFVRKYTGK